LKVMPSNQSKSQPTNRFGRNSELIWCIFPSTVYILHYRKMESTEEIKNWHNDYMRCY
jgi:hypothetical protein